MVVYLDGVIGLNFLVDLFLLLGVNRIAGYPAGYARAAAGALIGGGYAGACVIPDFRFLCSWFWRMVSLCVVSMAAFGMRRSALRRSILFVLMSMAMGGLVMSFDTNHFMGIIGSGGAMTLLCSAGFEGTAGAKKHHAVTIEDDGRTIQILALEDTGNTLRDPITGQQVLVAGMELAKWFGLTKEELEDPAQTLLIRTDRQLRLIPYRGVSGSGVMLGIRCSKIQIDGENRGRIIGFSPGLQFSGDYQALTGGLYE